MQYSFYENYVPKNVVFRPVMDNISVEKGFPTRPKSRQGRNMRGKYYVPDGTWAKRGLTSFYRYLVPDGTKKNEYFFEC